MQLLAIIVFCAFLVEAAAGFGSMVIALTVGALFYPVDELLLTLVPVNLVLSLWLVGRGLKQINWPFVLKKLLPLMGAGLAIGLLIASKASQATWLKPVFGLFVIAVSLWQLKAQGEGPPLPSPARITALLGAGIIHGIYATGGPLAVFVAARELPDKAVFRSTLSLLWVVMNVLVIGRYVFEGSLTRATLTTSAWMLLPLAAGIVVGEWIHHRLDERRFRITVAVLLLAAGATLTLRSVL